MLLKLIIFSVLVFLKIDILLTQTLTKEQLCGNNDKSIFDQFYVTTAFKIGRHIGVVGRLWKKSQKESEAINAVIRVLHWAQRDPTGHTSYTFFDSKVWNEILEIHSKNFIKFSFSTDNMFTLFPNQKISELVYLVEDTNKTTAYQFNYSRIESMEGPTYDPESDKKLVYDPIDDFDESEYLSIKFLYLHIPYDLRILSIMIYDRTPPKSKYAIHYAIVYTEGMTHPLNYDHLFQLTFKEMFEGKPYYFRHYLKSRRHEYKDYRGEDYTFYRLDWFFDENIDYCDQLTAPPTAVVLLRKETFIEMWPHIIDEIHFVEFYGLKHNLLKIRFDSRYESTQKYTIKEDNKQPIDNAEALLNCRQHEILTLPKTIPCGDYPNDIKDKMDGKNIFEYESGNQNPSENSVSVWPIIIAAVLVLIIVAVMVFSLYSVLTMDANNQKTDDI